MRLATTNDYRGLFGGPITMELCTSTRPIINADGIVAESCLFLIDGSSEVKAEYTSTEAALLGHKKLAAQYGLTHNI